jgi:hypothetical protein
MGRSDPPSSEPRAGGRAAASASAASTGEATALLEGDQDRAEKGATSSFGFVAAGSRRAACALLAAAILASTALCGSSPNRLLGFRRTVQFWTRVAPLIAEYKYLEWRARRSDLPTDAAWRRRFHRRTAPRVVRIVLDMRGVYVKIGQVLSSVGHAILPDEYVEALRPLQDGIPPRPFDEIRRIVEASTGRKLSEAFSEFDPVPLGSASIAQAHKARLVVRATGEGVNEEEGDNAASGDLVVVKVQYPDVGLQFRADLDNLERATRLLAPGQLPVIRSIRSRHEAELDFRREASHLIECRDNLARHFPDRGERNRRQPLLGVTIPRVRNETGLCTRNVLVMDHLEGTPLSIVLEAEQARMAAALQQVLPHSVKSRIFGYHDDGDASLVAKADRIRDVRRNLARRLLRSHFQSPGESQSDSDGDLPMVGPAMRGAAIWHIVVPVSLRLLHAWASITDRLARAVARVRRIRDAVVRFMAGSDRRSASRSIESSRTGSEKPRMSSSAAISIPRVLKTLLHVHGVQLLRDGVYNADPHPVRLDFGWMFRACLTLRVAPDSLTSQPDPLNACHSKFVCSSFP